MRTMNKAWPVAFPRAKAPAVGPEGQTSSRGSKWWWVFGLALSGALLAAVPATQAGLIMAENFEGQPPQTPAGDCCRVLHPAPGGGGSRRHHRSHGIGRLWPSAGRQLQSQQQRWRRVDSCTSLQPCPKIKISHWTF